MTIKVTVLFATLETICQRPISTVIQRQVSISGFKTSDQVGEGKRKGLKLVLHEAFGQAR